MKTFFSVLMALFSIFCVNAQNLNNLAVEKQYPDNAKALEVYQAAVARQVDSTTRASKITWIANKASNNWFLSLEGGVAWLGSENYRDIAIMDNLKPTGGLALGKWFNPVLGARLTLSGAKLSTLAYPGSAIWYVGQNHPGLSGKNSVLSYAVDDGTNPNFFATHYYNDGKAYKNTGGYMCDFTYGAASIDLMFNLKNLFGRYNPNAFFNPVIYGGIGYSHTLKDGDRTAVNLIMQRYGLQFNFRLSNHVDIYLAAEDMNVPEMFDRQVGGNREQDQLVSVKLGLTCHFGFNKFIKAPFCTDAPVAAAPAKPDMSQINALNAKINDLQARLSECLAAPKPAAPAASVAPKQVELTSVFFELDKYIVRPSEIPSIERAVNYLKENPQAKVVLAGFADKETGNPPHNLTLSKNRVNAVADIMVKQYGINKDRLLLVWKGDTVQPKSINEENRVVMFFK